MYIHTHTQTSVYKHNPAHTRHAGCIGIPSMYTCTYVIIYTHTHTHAKIYINIYIYEYTYMYIHIHIYIYI